MLNRHCDELFAALRKHTFMEMSAKVVDGSLGIESGELGEDGVGVLATREWSRIGPIRADFRRNFSRSKMIRAEPSRPRPIQTDSSEAG